MSTGSPRHGSSAALSIRVHDSNLSPERATCPNPPNCDLTCLMPNSHTRATFAHLKFCWNVSTCPPDIDLKDSKFGRVETAGIGLAVNALCTANKEDSSRLERGSALLDDLYEFFKKRKEE